MDRACGASSLEVPLMQNRACGGCVVCGLGSRFLRSPEVLVLASTSLETTLEFREAWNNLRVQRSLKQLYSENKAKTTKE